MYIYIYTSTQTYPLLDCNPALARIVTASRIVMQDRRPLPCQTRAQSTDTLAPFFQPLVILAAFTRVFVLEDYGCARRGLCVGVFLLCVSMHVIMYECCE